MPFPVGTLGPGAGFVYNPCFTASPLALCAGSPSVFGNGLGGTFTQVGNVTQNPGVTNLRQFNTNTTEAGAPDRRLQFHRRGYLAHAVERRPQVHRRLHPLQLSPDHGLRRHAGHVLHLTDDAGPARVVLGASVRCRHRLSGGRGVSQFAVRLCREQELLEQRVRPDLDRERAVPVDRRPLPISRGVHPAGGLLRSAADPAAAPGQPVHLRADGAQSDRQLLPHQPGHEGRLAARRSARPTGR